MMKLQFDSIRGDILVIEADEDLLRAMAIIGGNYDNRLTVKACDLYDCGALKQRVMASVVRVRFFDFAELLEDAPALARS